MAQQQKSLWVLIAFNQIWNLLLLLLKFFYPDKNWAYLWKLMTNYELFASKISFYTLLTMIRCVKKMNRGQVIELELLTPLPC